MTETTGPLSSPSPAPRRPDRRRAVKLVGLGALFPLAAACAVELPGSGEPPRIYVLTPKNTFPDDLPNADWQLLVEAPTAPAGLASSRIVLRRKLVEINYFARAAWTDSAPAMLQTLLIESFENSGRIVSVGRQVIGLRADFILKTDLREFQAEYMTEDGTALPEGTPPFVRVRLNGKLVQMPRREIVASETWEFRIQAASSEMEAIINAFDEAYGSILKRMVTWTLRRGEEIMTAGGADG
ncbi:membrane integrity-associated transporter subunit PqiC [Marivibrio halodurans]|uniref:Membrane integrity-associated transporter subunit PqiC n=1 Tax=Marivibrio halodurans TaxID=2039722 RepID=A0A8J7V2Q5_9PROT|nr:ABC-type transport auxiliary lipoprotein family protein [Marivibrio halodurans]MBP5857580.1 membrane integrity-associated transporter subunit PqiC [Marivibrio halodurans]